MRCRSPRSSLSWRSGTTWLSEGLYGHRSPGRSSPAPPTGTLICAAGRYARPSTSDSTCNVCADPAARPPTRTVCEHHLVRRHDFSVDGPVDSLYEAAFSVVVQWRDFSREPNSRSDALALLSRLFPTAPDDERSEALDAVHAAHERAATALPVSVRRRRLKLAPFSTRSDVDVRGLEREISSVSPDLPADTVSTIAEWTIYWHWIR